MIITRILLSIKNLLTSKKIPRPVTNLHLINSTVAPIGRQHSSDVPEDSGNDYR
jgi:hypothetical protein